jgi:hypothetical protein
MTRSFPLRSLISLALLVMFTGCTEDVEPTTPDAVVDATSDTTGTTDSHQDAKPGDVPPPADTASTDTGDVTPACLNPPCGTWYGVPDLPEPRTLHTATRLNDGRVLVVGGSDASDTPMTSALLFDPATNQWSTTGPMLNPRESHRATLLADGKVMVTGGNPFSPISSVEIYDPKVGLWAGAAKMNSPRAGHSATRLDDGRVLVAGGFSAAPLADCEVFDPASGTRLSDGRILVAGGAGDTGNATTNVETFDIEAGIWTAAPGLNTTRIRHTASLFTDGKILITGGFKENSSEIFDPQSMTWTPVGNLAHARYNHTASVTGGSVLVIGGWNATEFKLAAVERYDVTDASWSAESPLPTAIEEHTATALDDGSVLVVGGRSQAGNSRKVYRWIP